MSVIDMAKLIRERFKRIDRNIEIVVEESPTNDKSFLEINRLHYRTDNLKKIKIFVNDNPVEEIDQLISYCLKKFSKK